MTSSHRILTRLFVEIGKDRRSTATCSYLLHDHFSRCLNRRKGQVLRLVMTRQLRVRWIRSLCRTSRQPALVRSRSRFRARNLRCIVSCSQGSRRGRARTRQCRFVDRCLRACNRRCSRVSGSNTLVLFLSFIVWVLLCFLSSSVCCCMLCVASNVSVECVLWCGCVEGSVS